MAASRPSARRPRQAPLTSAAPSFSRRSSTRTPISSCRTCAGVVPPSARFLDWIAAIMAARRRYANPHDPVILAAARAGIEEARASGTGLIGDVTNTLVTVPLLRRHRCRRGCSTSCWGSTRTIRRRGCSQARAAVGAHAAGGDVRCSAWRRTRRIRCRRAFSLQSAKTSSRIPATFRACILVNRRRRSSSSRTGPGPWRDLLTTLGRVDRCVECAGHVAGAVPGRARVPGFARACRPRCAVRRRRPRRGCGRSARPSCPVRGATGTWALAIRRSRRSMRWA